MDTVELDVFAAFDRRRHVYKASMYEVSPPPRVYENERDAGGGRVKSLKNKGLQGKS